MSFDKHLSKLVIKITPVYVCMCMYVCVCMYVCIHVSLCVYVCMSRPTQEYTEMN